MPQNNNEKKKKITKIPALGSSAGSGPALLGRVSGMPQARGGVDREDPPSPSALPRERACAPGSRSRRLPQPADTQSSMARADTHAYEGGEGWGLEWIGSSSRKGQNKRKKDRRRQDSPPKIVTTVTPATQSRARPTGEPSPQTIC